jgi:hypothetical protein
VVGHLEVVGEEAHCDHTRVADAGTVAEVVADRTAVAGKLEEHNWDGSFEQIKEQVEEVAALKDAAEEDHSAVDHAAVGRVAVGGGRSATAADQDSHLGHLVDQELAGLYRVQDFEDCSQLEDLDYVVDHCSRLYVGKDSMHDRHDHLDIRLCLHEEDHRRGAGLDAEVAVHIRTEDFADCSSMEVDQKEEVGAEGETGIVGFQPSLAAFEVYVNGN